MSSRGQRRWGAIERGADRIDEEVIHLVMVVIGLSVLLYKTSVIK
jgi:hypothetical protein